MSITAAEGNWTVATSMNTPSRRAAVLAQVLPGCGTEVRLGLRDALLKACRSATRQSPRDARVTHAAQWWRHSATRLFQAATHRDQQEFSP